MNSSNLSGSGSIPSSRPNSVPNVWSASRSFTVIQKGGTELGFGQKSISIK